MLRKGDKIELEINGFKQAIYTIVMRWNENHYVITKDTDATPRPMLIWRITDGKYKQKT